MSDIAGSVKTKAGFEQLASVFTFSGDLEKAHDSDWVRLKLNAGVAYQFFVSFAEDGDVSLGDPRLVLHNALGQTLDTGNTVASGQYLEYTSPTEQVVFVEVFQGTAYYAKSGTYDIFVGANLPGSAVALGANVDEQTASGNQVLEGGLRGDILKAGATPSTLLGQAGNDILFGSTDGSPNIISGGQGNDTIHGGNGPDSLLGDAGDDEISGGGGGDALSGGAGGDFLDGGLGNDNVTGGSGRDRLFGGGNEDTFFFLSVQDSARGRTRDVIFDFGDNAGNDDKIDLSAIDANTGAAHDQAFKFIGAKAFHHKAGELHYAIKGGTTILAGDVNGDGRADFEIALFGAISTLGKSDFVL